VDPSGSFWAWKASAIGKNMVNAKTFLEKRCALVSAFPVLRVAADLFRSVRTGSHHRATIRNNRYNDDISLEDAIHTALLTLKEGFEGQMTEKTIEIGVVTVPSQAEQESGKVEGTGRYKPTFRKLTEEEIRDYLAL
jgi:20S proteasome subunit alpha 2